MVLMYGLTVIGRTVDDLGTKLAGDREQMAWKDKPVWHTKPALDEWVAGQLRLSQSWWGPNRKSNDLTSETSQVINNMRKRGELINWHESKKINVFRLVDPDKRVEPPDMDNMQSGTEPAVEDSTDRTMRKWFMLIISKSKKDNTYKFALGKTLLDYCKANAPDGTAHDISYDYLAGEFLKHYWYQRFKFRMKQDLHVKKQPRVITILEKVFGDKPPARYSDIPESQLKSARKQILNNVFGTNVSKKGYVIRKFQETRSGNTNLFYDNNEDRQTITLHPKAHSFFTRNNHILNRALLGEWVLYLEKANHGLPLLASKIMAKRIRPGSLTQYRDRFYKKTDLCFYCGNSFGKPEMHVDHFIPFSYIYDNSEWNLVLSCAKCNLSKSDALPRKNPYLRELVERNAEYEESIPQMKKALKRLAGGRSTWENEIHHHYTICAEYGFCQWDYRRPGGKRALEA